MKLLLDTHTVLWFLGGDPQLSAAARAAIEDLGNARLFSVAGAWEIAIKVSLKKLELRSPFDALIPGQLEANGIQLLPIRPAHMVKLLELPFHHRDPFDRMMVSQALTEHASLVSADDVLDDYGIERLW